MTWTGLIYRLRQGGARAGFAATVIQAFARLTVSRPPRIGLSAVVVGRNDDYMPDFAPAAPRNNRLEPAVAGGRGRLHRMESPAGPSASGPRPRA